MMISGSFKGASTLIDAMEKCWAINNTLVMNSDPSALLLPHPHQATFETHGSLDENDAGAGPASNGAV